MEDFEVEAENVPSSGNGSVSCRICETIREKILTGEFKPGQRMVEAKVAKSFGVSITPVREAFSTLVKQGLLTTFPYCGTYVTILTYEYAYDLIFVRKALETAAAKFCCVRFGILPKAVSPFSSRSPAPTARPLPPS